MGPFGNNDIDDDDNIFEPEDEYFGVKAPATTDDEPLLKIDGRSKAARAAKGILANGNRQKHKARPAGPNPPGMVTLTQEQLSKLWGVITGGRLVLDQAGGQSIAYVSLDSFEKALPILLERL